MTESQTTSSTTATPGQAPAPNVWVTLRYSDAVAAIRFLVDVVGFTERAVFTDQDDPTVVQHSQLGWPAGGGVMVSSEGSGRLTDIPVDAGSLYVVTTTDEQVDEIYRRSLDAGATSVLEPEDEPQGGRGATIRDPWGVHWSFGSYPGEPD